MCVLITLPDCDGRDTLDKTLNVSVWEVSVELSLLCSDLRLVATSMKDTVHNL